MQRETFVAFGLLLTAWQATAAPCDLRDKQPSFDAVKACLDALPFNETWRDGTLDTLEAAVSSYSFLDLYKNSGPPYTSNIVGTGVNEYLAVTYSE